MDKAPKPAGKRPAAPSPEGDELSRVSAIWQTLLSLPHVGADDNFFEVGGTSLLATMLLTRINQAFDQQWTIAVIFESPTVRAIAARLRGESPLTAFPAAAQPKDLRSTENTSRTQKSQAPESQAVAIIGMTGRFPGAASVEEFWQNLSAGVESITFFDQSGHAAQPEGYVNARPILDHPEMFDAAFFGVYPKEAEQMDPQHRVFLECAWEVLERAGYDPAHTRDQVGVFAGCSMNTYFMQNLAADRRYLEEFTGAYQTGAYMTMLGNDKDFLATRVSYKLNLRGPSITVQTACSTSLVAVCQACQSLLTDGCDMALAGAVSITFPQHRGYLAQEGGLASLDGHCRPFDHRANGTVFGHGAAVVLLKRLDRALADGDQVLAVIRGCAVNNDGSGKVGYTAPSVEGQAQVIARAQKMAGVPADSITYLEAHGTGTPLGDPIEIAALTRAFRTSSPGVGFCALGTAKANVGHLDVAAGATGLIKTVLQMEHRAIPKLLHFEQASPHIDLARSPFFVDRELRPWDAGRDPLRAGVSAFGVGGTNAHVIVEEPPKRAASSAGRRLQLLPWSARSNSAAAAIAEGLAEHFRREPHLNLADAAYTLQLSRSRHKHRRAIVAASGSEAASLLSGLATNKNDLSGDHPFENPSVVFCFPGQGVQSIGMCRQLYQSEPVFRQHVEDCDRILSPLLGKSLLEILYPADETDASRERINQTVFAQPSIFAVEYALAQLWLSWGIRPAAMVGHSVGEYVAACLAGVFSLEDALGLIAARGRLMQDLAPGDMLAVRAPEENVLRLMGDDLDLAAVNSPHLSVVSGAAPAIAAFVERLNREQIQSRRLITSHAFHSRMVDPMLSAFAQHVRAVPFNEPAIPYVSTLTGKWITPEEVAQPEYWTSQLRGTVRFGDAIRELLQTPQRILLEIGPGETAAQMIRQGVLAAGDGSAAAVVISSLPGKRDEERDEEKALLYALAKLWIAGAEPDWQAFHSDPTRRRVLLPTYPFERKRFWTEVPAQPAATAENIAGSFSKAAQIAIETQAASQTPSPIAFQAGKVLPAESTMDVAVNSAQEETMNKANQIPESSPDASMLNELKFFVADLSGADLSDADGDASFLELGFDSLFLTQLTQGIQGKYRVKLTFRQIMESYPTLGMLAAHLESVVPAQLRASASPALAAAVSAATAATPASVSATPAALPSGAVLTGGGYESLFAAQMQMLTSLFSQQLAVLQGQPAPPANPAAAAPIQTVPQAAPVESSAPATATPEAQPSKPVFTPFKPLQRGASGGLNPVQERYLKDFQERYARRTAASKSSTQKHRPVFADGRVVSGFNAQIKELIYPLVVDRASGAYLWDKDGNRYIDILNGYGAILYGHSPDFILEAVRRQLEIGFPIGPQTELAGECAQLIRDLTGMERVTFCNTGSEAVMGAMRLARTVTGRNLIVLFAGDYHGSFDEVLVKAVGNRRSMPVAPGIPRESVANILVLEYGTPESLEIIRRRADELAAVLVEPVQSRHPELQPAEFLREVRRITEQSGSALIFDEVVTGFRTHPGGMQAIFGVRADLATYGKVVAGGLPVGVLAGSATYMDALDGGQWQFGDDSFPEVGVTFYAGTFMRHPLAMAAVKASLEHLKASGTALQTALTAKTFSLVNDIRSMFRNFDYASTPETYSSWFYFGVAQEPRLARLLHFHLREKGVHIQEGFPCFLTTAHTDADLDFVRGAFDESLREMHAGQALGPAAPAPAAAATQIAPPPAAASATAPAALEPIAREIPITEPQREILLGTQLGDEANCAFNESTTLMLDGKVNQPALQSALERLIARHQSLRSTVDSAGDSIHVGAHTPLVLEQDDLTGLPAADRDATFQNLLRTEASAPFDLQHGPLFRVRLVALEEEKHALVFTTHHIIFDGWSTNVLYRELSEIYSGEVTGKSPALPEALSFHEYAAEQSRRNGTPERAEVESYWLNRFQSVPAPLELPTDRPRQALRTNTGATKRFVFPQPMYKSIRKAGARQGSTLFATLLAGYSLLVHRLSGQRDVVIGIPMAGQSLIENGSTLVGHCVNFLPIRSSYTPEESIAQFVKQTRKTLLDAQDHQDYTYGTLLSKLKVQRDPSRLQLVEVQFNLEQVGSGLKFEGLSVDLAANPKTSVNMDLFFNFVDRGTELWLDCDYNTDLFDASTIDRWFEHLQAILQAFIDNIEQPATEVSLLSTGQREEILTVWNRTTREYPRDSSIHRIFEQQAALTPKAIAVAGVRPLTYAELNEDANQLARFLVAAGVKPGHRVALCLERSLEAVVGLLGILKAGACYVPIDPSYPASRLNYLIRDSQARLLLSQRSIAANLPSLPATVLCLDEEWPVIALQTSNNLAVETRAEDPAYVMYTSGSTGNPKGVLVPQRAVLRLVKNNTFADFSAQGVFLQLAPLSFDAATFEIWGALLNGGRLVLGPQGRLAPEEIGKLIGTHNITTLWLTAALFHLMATEHLESLRPLKQLLAGGDVLSPTHVRRVLETFPALRLINGYGPTENTTFTCCHTITLDSLSRGTVPIGRPIANTRIYILDAWKKPVPPGVTGELYAAGDGLALGYLNAPDLTAEKFSECSFENCVTERLYRTGDLARYRADGTVEFLGRADTQVKIRGYRIELAEIESALESSPLVRSAVVALRADWVSAHDAPGDKRLAAYIVPAQAGDAAGLVQELRKHLREQLPEYMQPAAIMVLESLPRTLNGKVDRQALPAPQPEQLMRQRAMVYARNTHEETLADIWAKVLGLKEVGVEDSIFELGGDSLLIFRIVTLANQSNLDITVRHVFQHKTVAAICAALEGPANEATHPVKTIQAVPRARHRRPQTTLQ